MSGHSLDILSDLGFHRGLYGALLGPSWAILDAPVLRQHPPRFLAQGEGGGMGEWHIIPRGEPQQGPKKAPRTPEASNMDSICIHKIFPMFHVTNVGVLASQCDNLRPSSKAAPKYHS
eukprot:7903135-Pyramimonas_sp.AAC.2